MKDPTASSTGGAHNFLEANLPLILWTCAENIRSPETVPIVTQKWEKGITTNEGRHKISWELGLC